MVVRAVQMAVWQRHRAVCRMSAVGHCADNAVCEGFFGQLKRERVDHHQYRTCDEARADLFDYLERFHNPRMRRRVARQDRRFSVLAQPFVEMGWNPVSLSKKKSKGRIAAARAGGPRDLVTHRRIPSQQRARHTVDCILTAARQLVSEEGAAAVTTRKVADRAGVSVGSARIAASGST